MWPTDNVKGAVERHDVTLKRAHHDPMTEVTQTPQDPHS